MKIITLVPVKNEEFIIKTFLENASRFSDHIILADQHSTDRTREIACSFEKVILIDNDTIGHDNSVRWKLLDEARKIPGNNMMVAIDADEMISPRWFENIKNNIEEEKAPVYFSFTWVQLWNSFDHYRMDGIWGKSMKTCVWLDDRKVDYNRTRVINDHTSRVPGSDIRAIEVKEFPLLHYQFAFTERTAYKQAWYRMNEFIAGKKAQKINLIYSASKEDENMATDSVQTKWLADITLPQREQNLYSWHKTEIENWFKEYGITYFEPLDIWHIKEFKESFIKETGRTPKSKKYPGWLIKINNIRHALFKK